MVKPMILWSHGITFEHLNSINLNHYSQASSNNRPCKTTNAESVQANSRQLLLSNATSDHFFDSQMKHNLVSNNNYKTLSSEGMQKKHKEQCIKNKRLSGYIYSIANL